MDDSPFVHAEEQSKALMEPLIAHLLVYTAQRWWLDKQLISLETGPNWRKPVICDRGEIETTLMGKRASRSKSGTSKLSTDWLSGQVFHRSFRLATSHILSPIPWNRDGPPCAEVRTFRDIQMKEATREGQHQANPQIWTAKTMLPKRTPWFFETSVETQHLLLYCAILYQFSFCLSPRLDSKLSKDEDLMFSVLHRKVLSK